MRRSLDPSDLHVSPDAAGAQTVHVLDLDAPQQDRLGLDRLELVDMSSLTERDLLWRAICAPDGWGLYAHTTPLRLTPMSMHGPTADARAVEIRVVIDRDPAWRPPGDTGPDMLAHRTEAALGRIPLPGGGYRLEPLQRDAGGYSRLDSLMVSLLINIDYLANLPTVLRLDDNGAHNG